MIDEETPQGEVRVTVIATGLDDGRGRRTRDEEPAREVSPLRSVESQAPAAVEVLPHPWLTGGPDSGRARDLAPLGRGAPERRRIRLSLRG